MVAGAGVRITLTAALAATMLLTGCATPTAPQAQETVAPTAGAPQKTSRGTLSVNDRERHYRLSTPDGFYRGRQWPVIFAFHGWEETAEELAATTGLDQAPAIVIYPQGVDNAWAPAPYAETAGEEDLAFVQTLLDEVVATFPTDRNRIFATGFSNGGGFAAYLSCHMPDTFHAIAPVGAAYYETIHQDCSQRPVAMLDIHGTHDDVISYNGGRRHGTDYEPVQEILDDFAERNRCNGVTSTRNSQEILAQHWLGCRLPVVHLRVDGGTHVWPDGATSEVRNFFGV